MVTGYQRHSMSDNKYIILDVVVKKKFQYRSGTVNSNTVNSKFHLIRSYCEMFFYNFPSIPCLKYTVNSNFHLIRSKTLPTNDFELTVPDLYLGWYIFSVVTGNRYLDIYRYFCIISIDNVFVAR